MMLMELLTSDGISLKRKTASEHCSSCPSCGGEDRFLVFQDKDRQRYWCRQCDIKGDAIQYLRDFRGLSYQAATEYVGKKTGPSPTSQPHDDSGGLKSSESPQPPSLWREKAESCKKAAHTNLMNNEKQLSWLERERGISQATATRFQLGWMDKDYWVDRSSFGLPANGKKLFLPSGLVIPYNDRRIRIRRDKPGNFGRYYLLPGSSAEPMVIGSPEGALGIIVESELDAILLAQKIEESVYLVSLGSAQARPSFDLIQNLKKCELVLVALDSDEAGGKAAQKWKSLAPFSYRTPPPPEYGKDITEGFLEGLDLKAWVKASVLLALG